MTAAHRDLDVIDAPDLAASLCSGRATWDERGNSVWEWQTAPGVYSRDISWQQLQQLQDCDLRVIDEEDDSRSWSRYNQHATGLGSTELVMPVRTRQPVSRAFELFLKRIGVSA